MDEGGVENRECCLDRLGDVNCYFVSDEDGYSGVGGDSGDVVALWDTRGEGYGWHGEICHG